MKVRTLESTDLEAAGALLFQVFKRAADQYGYTAPWGSEDKAGALLSVHARAESDFAVVAEEGGAVIGVGTARVRGEVASIGPVAAYVEGHGIGGAIMDELLARVDGAGALASRLYVEAWNPAAYALYAGRGFAVIDNAIQVERPPGPAPALDSSRGLEVRPAEAGDLEALRRLDHRLTGHDRGQGPRRGGPPGRPPARRYRGVSRGAEQVDGASWLGPAAAVDASDLVTLLAGALAAANSDGARRPRGSPVTQPMAARLSTTAPAVSMAAIGLGFRVLRARRHHVARSTCLRLDHRSSIRSIPRFSRGR